MAKSIQRVGDQNTGGGVITNGDNTVLVNGRAVAIRGSSVSPHPCCGRKYCPPVHCNARTQTNNGTVLVNGIPLIFTDDIDTCGHARASGSADVSVG